MRAGLAFRPLRVAAEGYTLQLRVEPGTPISHHRLTEAVHALNLSGCRGLIETQEVARPGTYVDEPPGNVDGWQCLGDAPCVVQITLTWRIEYLCGDGTVCDHSDVDTARRTYLDWCRTQGISPDVGLGLRADGSLR